MSGERMSIERLAIDRRDTVENLGPDLHDRAVATVTTWARRHHHDTDTIRTMCWHLGLDRDTAIARALHTHITTTHGPNSALATVAAHILTAAQHAHTARQATWETETQARRPRRKWGIRL